MNEIARILVPVDLSEHSRAALDDALALAKAFGAEIHLLHCYPTPLEAIDLYGIDLSEDLDGDIRRSAASRVEPWVEAVRAEGVQVTLHLSSRSPSDHVAAAADELNVDLIVMATRGHSGIKRVMVGSVTERTLRAAPCPVWVTPRLGES